MLEDIAKEEEKKLIAKDKCTRLQYELDQLEKKKKGKARAKDIEDKINNFIKSDKDNIKNREKFINWLHSENLVMTYDFNWDGTRFSKSGIGIGKYDYNSGKLIQLDETIEALVAYQGWDPENATNEYLRREEEKAKERNTPRGRRWEKYKTSEAYKIQQKRLRELREKNKAKDSICYEIHGCITPPDWKGEDNMAYEKYWWDIERKAGRVTNVGYPIKWLDSRMIIEYIDLDNKYEYFSLFGYKYNKNEYKKLDKKKIDAIRDKLIYQEINELTNTLKVWFKVRAKNYD